MVSHPLEARFDLLISDVAGALQSLVSIKKVLRDKERRDTGGGLPR
jgi:hypothetical protein